MTDKEFDEAIENVINTLADILGVDCDTEYAHNEDDENIEVSCDGNCDECELAEEDEEYLEPIAGVAYGFEDVLFFVKRDKLRAFTCHSFKDGEFIYLDDITYDTPTLVKVSEHNMHSVYVPTAQDMFDYVWELVVEG